MEKSGGDMASSAGKHKRLVFKRATLSTSDGSVCSDRGKTITNKKDSNGHI